MTLLDCTIRVGPEVAGVAGAQDADERSAELAAVRAGTVGRVHSWELVTGVDGPGTRLTVFLAVLTALAIAGTVVLVTVVLTTPGLP